MSADQMRQSLDRTDDLGVVICRLAQAHRHVPGGRFDDACGELVARAQRRHRAGHDRWIALAARDLDGDLFGHTGRIGQSHPLQYLANVGPRDGVHVLRLVEVGDDGLADGQSERLLVGLVLEIGDDHTIARAEEVGRLRFHYKQPGCAQEHPARRDDSPERKGQQTAHDRVPPGEQAPQTIRSGGAGRRRWLRRDARSHLRNQGRIATR